MNPICNSYYGAYRTRTFANIFPSLDTWEDELEAIKLNVDLLNAELGSLTLDQLYYMLYARYGNSNIAYSDENQFKYALALIIKQYGPAASKRLYIQEKLMQLEDDELIKGGKAIYNHSYNPSTSPSTDTLEELPTINDQNTTNYKKSQMEGYATLLSLVQSDVLEEFLRKFEKLFIKILAPDYPLLYITED